MIWLVIRNGTQLWGIARSDWPLLVEETLDAEFPDFEVLQSFVIFSLDAEVSGDRARKLCDKFCQCFHDLLPDKDKFFKQWANVRLRAMNALASKQRLDGDAVKQNRVVFWKQGLAEWCKGKVRQEADALRIALSLDMTITGSSCGIERLFARGTQKITPQKRGHLSEESKRIFYVLLSHGPLKMNDMLIKKRQADGTDLILASKLVRRAQQIWVREQGRYQGRLQNVEMLQSTLNQEAFLGGLPLLPGQTMTGQGGCLPDKVSARAFPHPIKAPRL